MSAKPDTASTYATSSQPLDRLQELLDRQDILDCIPRYCRAVDRFDRELLLSCYHPDAIDDHGMFVGGREAFADWAFGYHSIYQNITHHVVTNHTCDLDGDVAYVLAVSGLALMRAPLARQTVRRPRGVAAKTVPGYIRHDELHSEI